MKDIDDITSVFNKDKVLSNIFDELINNGSISNDNYDSSVKIIKETVFNYYLQKYKFSMPMTSDKVHAQLIYALSSLCDLNVSARCFDNKLRFYSVKASDEVKYNSYKEIVKQLIDYQIEHKSNADALFEAFGKMYNDKYNEILDMLKNKEMIPYYGSMEYMIKKSLYMADCIKQIPGVNMNIDTLIEKIKKYDEKYGSGYEYGISDSQAVVLNNDDVYKDYEDIEMCYRKMLAIDNSLSEVVVDCWKEYLSNPNSNDANYRYITHSFSRGAVDPKEMNKACCSLSTPDIKNIMYGNIGLVYEMDAEAIDSMCCEDAGSWVIDKDLFFKRGCPTSWQYVPIDGSDKAIFYEYPKTSKCIMPQVLEKDCLGQISRNTYSYSEIVLNSKAKAIGVFYTDECNNFEEVEEYAKKYNLPIVKVAHQSRNKYK